MHYYVIIFPNNRHNLLRSLHSLRYAVPYVNTEMRLAPECEHTPIDIISDYIVRPIIGCMCSIQGLAASGRMIGESYLASFLDACPFVCMVYWHDL